MPTLPKLEWLAKAVSILGDSAQGGERLKNLSQLPKVEKYFSPLAAVNAIRRSDPGQVIALTPEEFLYLAAPLQKSQAQPYINHYKDLISKGDWVDPLPGLFMDHYLEFARNRPFEGFSDIPFLEYMQDPSLATRGQIRGHEGRHRMNVVQELDPGIRIPVRISTTRDTLPEKPRLVYPETGSGDSLDLTKLPRFADGGIVRGALGALQRAIIDAKNSQEAKEVLSQVTKRGSSYSPDHKIIANEMMSNADGVPTTVLRREGAPVAAYQLEDRPDGTMLSYLLSLKKGSGSSTLEDAYQAAQKKPVYLHAVPGSEDFYRKQPGWVELDDNGIPKFIRKRTGGII